MQRVPRARSLGECSALGRSLLCQEEPEGRPLGWTSQHGTSVCCPREQSPAAPMAPKGKWRKPPKRSELKGLGPGASWCSCAACVRLRVSVRPWEATIKSRRTAPEPCPVVRGAPWAVGTRRSGWSLFGEFSSKTPYLSLTEAAGAAAVLQAVPEPTSSRREGQSRG
ncbi:NADH dehydrogenase [ubiquinone] 1 alpha subcomplex assembly factor 8 isoform X1 [Neovison vison]|uniref:NADH dehydrogenase [ubiquinone] 1 alpha subcomplex assembly factor 8 isoform X1 n=1 Tax=Neovison vison TaxID=452646 RepID=UPI001CF0D219|nr:NADH dehydrogenase [ubiquinone] 1 alpha subcomplex assembly factor 8 isoform X1 [Neogale vison]